MSNNYFITGKEIYDEFAKNLPIEHKFSISDYNNKTISVFFWHKKDGDFCYEGEEICMLKINLINITISTPVSGLLRFEEKEIIKFEDILFEIISTNMDSKTLSVAKIEVDEFSKSENLIWKKVGGNNYDYGMSILNGYILTFVGNYRLFITINNINGLDYFVLNFPKKDYYIKKGDKFQILLESGEIINLVFFQDSYLVHKHFDFGSIFENKVRIIFSDLEKLSQHKVENWKLVLQSGQEISGIKPFRKDHGYKTFDRLQDMIQLLEKDYIREVNNLKNHAPLFVYDEIKDDHVASEVCYLYLMVDKTNGFHKIGISNKPEYREKTLQSEKPTIELIASKKFPSRQIAVSIEKALHFTFKEKNIRGEWFNLLQKDIAEIIETLK